MLIRKIKSWTVNSRLAGAIALLVIGGTIYGGIAYADHFDSQINQLQQQNSGLQSQANALAAQASSYQDAINKLDQQINALQQSIVANQQKSDELQAQIVQAQADLEHQKKVLGENIKTMYLEGHISTLEVLASSNNLSDFVNKQEYRNSVQSKVKATLDKINVIKAQLEEQQRELQVAIADLKSQQSQLSSVQAQQSQMLAYTEGQKAAYDQQIQSNKSQIADLRRQQAIENARLFAGNGSYIVAGNNGNDTYPNNWRNAGQDSLIDSWGMYNRECVSYTAWKVYESGRYMPYWGGVGNANQWDDDARAAGIPVDSSPRQGDVAIKNSYPYGHAMYVEHVYGDGSIYVSQYNTDLTGHYSEAYLSALTVQYYGLLFIHF
ncbi:CHAP domain-containing protein [Candidatus Saccharibacteria bacterium]|nr:CHAP domain-containing protein [Candidatus Saccharibacteria bacterium]